MSGALIGTAAALAPGTCGELVQGMTGDGIDFLITCPVNQFARATAAVYAGPGKADAAGADDSPAVSGAAVSGIDHLPKTRQAVALALAEIQLRAGGSAGLSAAVSVSSPIPVGKGMGSSSADIAAAVSAVVAAGGVALPPAVIARIALAVEPTDGIMFPGIAMFDHRQGQIAEPLGTPPPLEVIAIDRGGQVDTLAFNAVDRRAQWAAVSDQTAAACDLVREGIRRGDPELVGRGATISAQVGHPPDAGQWVARAIALAEEIGSGAVGVNVAHSGTVVGILLDARQRRSKPAFRRAQREFADAAGVQHFRVIGGGVRRLPAEPGAG